MGYVKTDLSKTPHGSERTRNQIGIEKVLQKCNIPCITMNHGEQMVSLILLLLWVWLLYTRRIMQSVDAREMHGKPILPNFMYFQAMKTTNHSLEISRKANMKERHHLPLVDRGIILDKYVSYQKHIWGT